MPYDKPITIYVDGTQVDMMIVCDGGSGVVIEANHDLDNPPVLQAFRFAQRFCLPAMDAIETISYAQLYISRDTPGRDIKEYEKGHDKTLIDEIEERVAAISRCYKDCGVDFSDDIDEHGQWLINFLLTTKESKAKEITYSAPKPHEYQDRPGYVYILQSDSGLYKIGRTVDPHNRIKTFHVKLPFVVAYTLVIKSEAHIQLERDLHQRFGDKRKDGEWFALRSSDIEALRKEYKDEVVPNL